MKSWGVLGVFVRLYEDLGVWGVFGAFLGRLKGVTWGVLRTSLGVSLCVSMKTWDVIWGIFGRLRTSFLSESLLTTPWGFYRKAIRDNWGYQNQNNLNPERNNADNTNLLGYSPPLGGRLDP